MKASNSNRVDEFLSDYADPRLRKIHAVASEIKRARAKFPGGRFMLAALVEEVGELAEAIAAGDREAISREAIQVAAVAVRIAEDGDKTTYQIDGFIQIVAALGRLARCLLQRDLPNTIDALSLIRKTAERTWGSGDPTFDDVTDEEAQP